MHKFARAALAAGALITLLGACSPEVGTEAWCKAMDKKDKGDWTMKEASDYAKHCIIR